MASCSITNTQVSAFRSGDDLDLVLVSKCHGIKNDQDSYYMLLWKVSVHLPKNESMYV